MTSHSSFKQRLKRLVGGSGKEDGSPKDGAVSLSTNGSQTNINLRPHEQVALSTKTTTLGHADTAIHTASNRTRATALGEISQRVTDGQTPDITEDLATNPSLWDRAYDTLKDEKHDLIAEYEDLLSRVLIRARMNTQPIPSKLEDTDEVTNEIPQHNVITRREKLKEIVGLGLQCMEDKKVSATLLGHEIVLQDVVATVAGAVEWAEDYIKDAIKDLPYASIVMAGVSLVLPLLKNPTAVEAANQGGFNYVTSQMRYYVAMESLLLPEDMKLDLKDSLTERLVDLYKLITDLQVRSVLRFYRSRTKNFLRGTIKYDDWDKKLQDIKDGEKELVSKYKAAMSGTHLDLVSKSLQELKSLAREAEESRKALNGLLIGMQEQLSVLQKIDQHITDPQNQICLQNLRTTDPRHDKTRIQQANGGLLEDSYRWVLESAEFQKWRDDEHSRLLWIKGDPGKGKTMLLCGIIDELRKTLGNTSHLSFFFCQATDSRINSATAVMRGLIYLLAEHQPSLLSHIRKRYDNVGSELFKDANAWVALSEIFTSMLEDINLQSTWFIIDALDECVTDLPKLLNFIVHNSSASFHVKWIVSSRNWPSIEECLDTATRKVRLQLELNAESISAAVHSYILFKVEQLAQQKRYDDDTRAAVQKHLLSNANDTFLWVALVCQELARPEVRRRHTLAKLRVSPRGLNHLYRRMLNQIYSSEDTEICKRILAVVSTVYRPVTLDELACFVDMSDGASNDESLTEIIGLCGSFLSLRERTIFFVHQSAKDFLIKEGSSDIFSSGIEHVHYTIFYRSLQVMSRTLRCDIYRQEAPGISLDQIDPPDPDPLAAARYSCLNWVDHLLDCDHDRNSGSDSKYSGLVDQFLRKSYLYWLEALSLLRSLSNSILMMKKLEHWLQANESPNLYIFVQDAVRFVLYSRSIVEQNPLQLYCSALVFAPKQSITRVIFEKCIPPWIKGKPQVQTYWNAVLQTLDAYAGFVTSVAFSPDGKQVVSGSHDKKARIWDPATGVLLQTLNAHTKPVTSVAFSPDSKQVVSGSSDRTIRLWDPAIGLLQTLEGHTDSVTSVAFSPDGKQVVSGSSDRTIRLWDPVIGLLQTLEGHTGSVTSVAFSPDGKQVVSGSSDMTIRFWDAATGALSQALKGHSALVSSIAFSTDGKQFVSGSYDMTIRLWDPTTGALLQILEGHTSAVTSVAFSPNGKRVVSGSYDETARFWDPATGALLQTFKGHSLPLTSVAFSTDGKQFVSGSDDMTIRLWDPAIGLLQTLEGHTDSVTSVAFSPDGKQVVSGSSDKTIRLWDPATGVELQTIKGHTSSVSSVAFSHDGKRIVSGSYDQTVRFWDPATGALLQTLEGHTRPIVSVAFSPDGKTVVSGSYDEEIKLWDATIGALLQTLEGPSNIVSSVSFSPDGKQVVSRSYDQTTRLWDAATGVLMQTLESHTPPLTPVAFSPDEELLPALLVSNYWVVEGVTNILRLPPDYRPYCKAIWNSTVVLGHSSGRISFLEFTHGPKLIK